MAQGKIVCDTDVMIDFWDISKARHESTSAIIEKEIQLDNIILSAITKMELMVGALNKIDMKKIVTKLNRFSIALLDENITLKSIDLLEKYRLSHGLTIPDSLIAATALAANTSLFTYNLKDYRFIDGLKLYIVDSIS